ncbi:MAG: SAF domain-containing protein, partial [Pirellulales bacterium]
MPSLDVIQLDPCDNVCVAIRDLAAGDVIRTAECDTQVAEPIRHGHKLAVAPIEPGRAVIKYGHPIGRATRSILPGQWVHTHNLVVGEAPARLKLGRAAAEGVQAPSEATFLGYRRPNGSAGTRNYVAILSTVNCSATVA